MQSAVLIRINPPTFRAIDFPDFFKLNFIEVQCSATQCLNVQGITIHTLHCSHNFLLQVLMGNVDLKE